MVPELSERPLRVFNYFVDILHHRRVCFDWGRWWRNFAQGALVADSGSLGECTHPCRTRVMEGFPHMHVSSAPVLASHWAKLETLLSQMQLPRG